MDRPLFQAAEILDMAIEIEREGLAYYTSCRAARADERVAEVFDYAAQQERDHIRTFTKMKADLDQYTVPESYPGETLSYIRSLVGKRIFEDVDAASCAAEAIEDVSEAVDQALELERRTVNLYAGLRELVRQSERDTVDEILAEEHRHIRRLLQLRHQLGASQSSEAAEQGGGDSDAD